MAKKSILLLISDSLVRSVISETLERAGYLVFPTGDLGSAVDWLKSCSPDLLITRPYVSGMTGHEAAKYLHGKPGHARSDPGRVSRRCSAGVQRVARRF